MQEFKNASCKKQQPHREERGGESITAAKTFVSSSGNRNICDSQFLHYILTWRDAEVGYGDFAHTSETIVEIDTILSALLQSNNNNNS